MNSKPNSPRRGPAARQRNAAADEISSLQEAFFPVNPPEEEKEMPRIMHQEP